LLHGASVTAGERRRKPPCGMRLGRILDHSNLHPGEPNAMMAKFRIAELLGIRINSVERFKDLAGL